MTPDQVTADMIQRLRDEIDEQDNIDPYTDAQLTAKIVDANGVEQAAYGIWVVKAAAMSTLVDITEGSSGRKNSQAYANAQAMVKHFQQYVPTTIADPARVSRTRAIVRP